MSFKRDMRALAGLTLRNVKVFLKDKLMVFFSILAPLIILMLYILFLGDVQVEAVRSQLPEIITDKQVGAFVDSWLIAGVLAVSCLTVALSAAGTMVTDKEQRIGDDFLASPCKPYVISLSYIISCLFLTLAINILILCIGFIYLAASGSFLLSTADVFEIIGIIVLSCLSSSIFMTFVVSFLKTSNSFGGFTGIFSALVGFIIGAYMPLALFPKALQYICAVIPGSYSAMLFRNVLMSNPLEAFGAPAEVTNALSVNFSMNLDAFGTPATKTAAYLVLVGSILLFAAVNILSKSVRKSK